MVAWTQCSIPGCTNQTGGNSTDCGSTDANHISFRLGMGTGWRATGTAIGKGGTRGPITPPPRGGKPKGKGCPIVLLTPAVAIAAGVTLLRRRT